jgi:hypothetical protein
LIGRTPILVDFERPDNAPKLLPRANACVVTSNTVSQRTNEIYVAAILASAVGELMR